MSSPQGPAPAPADHELTPRRLRDLPPGRFASEASGVSAPPPTLPPFAGSPLILLPALNEAEGLQATLRELEQVAAFGGGLRPQVLVVDGRSTDGTREVARAHGARLLVQSSKGKGGAVREGLAWAREHGFDTVSVLDADGTYPCDRLPAMIRLLEGEADVVAGIRRPTEPSGVSPRNLVHRVGNGVLNLCAAELSGGPILDVCTGFWGIRTRSVERLELESTGFEVESELFVKAMRRGLRVVQIPVDYRPRIGEAKLHAVRDGARIFLSILHHARRGPSARAPLPSHPRRRPTGVPGFARSLNTVLAAFQASSIIVVAPTSRIPEAVEVARSVREERPGAAVSTVVSVPDPGDLPREPLPAPGDPSGGDHRTVVITLPDPVSGLPGPRSAFVRPPSGSPTLLVVPAVARGRAPPRRFLPALFGHRERQAPGAFAILRATLDASGVQREVALATANAAWADVRVTEAPSARRRTLGSPLGGPVLASAPVAPRV